ncbi:DNA-binding protein [Meiothermus sp.]|uniref:DNA-binding protein n=1 Tax=Meiothermus sp. TaxID=1955249 RepID=UPI00307CF138
MYSQDVQGLRSSIGALLEHHPDKLAQVLAHRVGEADGYAAAKNLVREVFALLTPAFLRQHPEVAALYARTLCSARMHQPLLELSDTLHPAPARVQLFRSWALLRTQRTPEALALLEDIKSELEAEDRGWWLRFRADALAYLNQPGWMEVFRQARQCLRGGALGRCLMDWGNHHFRLGEPGLARGLWAEALAHLTHDPYYLAWLHHSLGITVLHSQPSEAERHLLQAVELSKSKEAEEFRARALCGLGAVRRVLGEWDRALFSYQQAARVAVEPDDLQEAYWGMGYTHRLSGKPAEAMGCFWQAHAAEPADTLYIDIAIVHLMLGNRSGAEAALSQALQIAGRDAMRAQLARAELARQQRQLATLEAILPTLDWSQPWLQEERYCLPALFAEAQRRGLLKLRRRRSRPLAVEVRAAGLLRVWVNKREIPLAPTSRAAEVLVLLLEHGGEVTLDQLMDKLYPQKLNRRKASQALWPHLERLREALGWEKSVEAQGGTYRLDPRVQWRYDLHLPGTKKNLFLEGIYTNWVQARREELTE